VYVERLYKELKEKLKKLEKFLYLIRGAVKKSPEMWYSSVMVGHMTTLT